MTGQRTHTTTRWLAFTGIALGVAVGGVSAVTRAERHHGSQEPRAKNVLLFVGNGMRDSDVAAARNYLVGADGLLWMETLSPSSEDSTSAQQGMKLFSADERGDAAATGGVLTLARRAGFRTASIGSPIAESDSEDPAVLCEETERPVNAPSLAAMTATAIERLNHDLAKGLPGSPGFFLQINGAWTGKDDRADNLCQRIGEIVAFNRAIGVALKFAEHEPDTLVLVERSSFRVAAQGAGDAGVVEAARQAGLYKAVARTLTFD